MSGCVRWANVQYTNLARLLAVHALLDEHHALQQPHGVLVALRPYQQSCKLVLGMAAVGRGGEGVSVEKTTPVLVSPTQPNLDLDCRRIVCPTLEHENLKHTEQGEGVSGDLDHPQQDFPQLTSRASQRLASAASSSACSISTRASATRHSPTAALFSPYT